MRPVRIRQPRQQQELILVVDSALEDLMGVCRIRGIRFLGRDGHVSEEFLFL